MRVLFTGHGARGHVLPLSGLARALVDEGHDVLVATSPELCPVVASLGIDAVPAGMGDDAMVAEAQARWPETRSSPAGAWAFRMFCEIAAPAMTAALGPVIEGWKPDIVVREEGEYGGPVAAAIAGIPWVTHGWGCPLPGPETWVELGRLVAPQWEAANLALPNGPALYGQAVLDPSPPSLYAPAYPPLPHRHGIRPSPPDAGPDPGRAGRQRTGRRLAYVGFGTVALFRDPHDLLTAVVTELLALDFDVSVTTGSSQLAELLRALSPERVEVGPWVDLAALVPRCAVVVCHGGAGTVLAALAAGVPLVLLPRGAPSQLRMSAACDRRGVGRAVAWKGGNDDQIGHALREVTTSEQIRDAASAVAAEIAAMPDPSTAIAILHAVSTR